jgi:hypothetical protein
MPSKVSSENGLPDRAQRRILVINSVDDQLTERRGIAQRRDPSLAEYEVENTYAVVLPAHLRERSTRVVMDFVKGQGLDVNSFHLRVCDAIATFHPSLCIVHAGFVFQDFTEQFMSVIERVKVVFPSMRFIIHPDALRFLAPVQSSLFDRSSEHDSLFEIFF